ncbi:MAG: tetratricopeptide repeat protein [Sulfuricaulis sp.]|uniref:YfgM family protein n=1 Tax=Sulfuricaulis sp. TaxID=2003553 RepID=UPI0025FD4520|nr:tetratricopeptide repeat protein [Sulfuricaulis sp.]MCR4346568.1 tetratricopeptide repeat protein [Sulfuricaulis sp.]
MTAYEEQEDLDRLKTWWKTYGNSVIFGILLGVAILVGFRYWTQNKELKLHTAAGLYERMFQDVYAKKSGDALKSGELLINEYSSTPYAGMAGLMLARMDFEAGDAAKARERLQWVMEHADDAAVKHAARMRLARIHLGNGDKEAALVLLNVKDRAGFETEYEELKGDILVAQGQRDGARTAYREALKHLPTSSPYAPILNMKLDDLGPEKTP